MSKNNPAAAEFGRPNSGASMATATKPSRVTASGLSDYDDIASAASVARRLSRSRSRLLPASAAAASNATRASS
jgi:hypothetical protein